MGAPFVRPPSSPLKGDGSERGQPDVFAIERPYSPSSPSCLRLLGARSTAAPALMYDPSDARTEERSMRAALDNQATHTANIAVITSARTQYPAIREALLRRMAGGIEPGQIHLLPIPAIDALANAQRNQDIARAICIRSASAEAAIGSAPGAVLAEILSEVDLYDQASAKLIDNATLRVDMYAAEVIAGIVPHAALCMLFISKYHNNIPSTDNLAEVYEAAEEIHLHVGDNLDIYEGCRPFFKAYASLVKSKRPYDVGRLYRTLGAKIGQAAHVNYKDGDRCWRSESTKFVLELSQRKHPQE